MPKYLFLWDKTQIKSISRSCWRHSKSQSKPDSKWKRWRDSMFYEIGTSFLFWHTEMQWLSKYYPSPQWWIKVIQWCRQNRIVFLNSLLGYKMRLMTAFYVRASFHLQLFCWTCASLATERKADEDVFHLSLRLNVKITIICTESRVDFQKVTNRHGRYSYKP